MIISKKVLGLQIFLFTTFASQLSWGDPSENLPSPERVKKEFAINLISGMGAQKLIVERNDIASLPDRLVLLADVSGERKVIFSANSALAKINNAYSPSSFDGFEVSVLQGIDRTISVVDSQAETYTFNSDSHVVGDVVNLVTKKEDEVTHNFNVQFQYDAARKSVAVSKLVYTVNNESCDRSLKSAYVLPVNDLISKSIESFDGVGAFEYLQKLNFEIQEGRIKRQKLMSSFVVSTADQALAAFKGNDKNKLIKAMGSLVADGGDSESCAPESYIAEAYYYPDKVSWSNDLGFLFAEAGYYAESVELLKKVISENPERTVAYLNIADAYWGLSRKELAVENYNKYSSMMKQSGKGEKVPKRVVERSGS
ncbi:tetratricopeptide repeat protein [Pseudomonas fluorescens]|uniref:tetratricopeptide repeat protein n=1 Tax=Pseudomonas fluorescens TaxID=294 RepID=UPI00259BF36A|nr:tetratricopeptide repeat protein [Pseudomonas fluorescens]WJK09799.1 tetratricopeptide repeat protein [Pseudomonas fluorescens]